MNILVLTSVYRDESLGDADKSTNIVNLFVREWKKMGHDVMVIHNSHQYPLLLHLIPRKLKNKIAANIGFYISDYDAVKSRQYVDQGVAVYRIPIHKIIPHRTPKHYVIKKQVSKIIGLLRNQNWKPDIIIGHWASPQIEIISELKKTYSCKNAVVLHGTDYVSDEKFRSKGYLSNIDLIGCRSHTQAQIVKEMLSLPRMPFVCSSGVPDDYLKKFPLNIEKYNNINKWKFVYVGRLVKYKRIDSIIKVLASITNIDWELDIIGEGSEKGYLTELAAQLHQSDRIHFCGRISRDEVMNKMKNAHCFIMVSKNEIFGLVYLEAMAASCITIGSKGEGIDGILVNNENGFLCDPDNNEELRDTIISIANMNSSRLIDIASSAYNTALANSDSKAAETYLNNVLLNSLS